MLSASDATGTRYAPDWTLVEDTSGGNSPPAGEVTALCSARGINDAKIRSTQPALKSDCAE